MPLTLNDVVAFLKGRRKREKHERVEQMTKGPGELRDVEIPEKK